MGLCEHPKRMISDSRARQLREPNEDRRYPIRAYQQDPSSHT